RRPGDQEHFAKDATYPVHDIIGWTKNGIHLLDSFASFLLKKYVLLSFNMDEPIVAAKRDKYGFPRMFEDGRIDVETVTIRQYLTDLGIQVDPKPEIAM